MSAGLIAFSSDWGYSSILNTIKASNTLDPDQERHSVGPDLGPKCLQRLSASDKSCRTWTGSYLFPGNYNG